MDMRTQAQIILEELRAEYSFPFCFDEDAIRGIEKGLVRIERGEVYDGETDR